jgi:hypothetical protein
VSERTPIKILDAGAMPPAPVEAILIDGVTLAEAQEADLLWMPAMDQLTQEAALKGIPPEEWPEHRDWRWTRLRQYAAGTSRFLGIECRGEMQGMIWLHMDETGRLPGRQGSPLAYVERVAVAPWNYEKFLMLLGRQPRFRGCGSVFIRAAIQASVESGGGGCIGLHSLPDAEGFYRDTCHMTDMGIDPDPVHEGLRYFEMTAAQARAFIERRKP